MNQLNQRELLILDKWLLDELAQMTLCETLCEHKELKDKNSIITTFITDQRNRIQRLKEAKEYAACLPVVNLCNP